MENRTLQQDNSQKLTIICPTHIIEEKAKDVLGWRTPTKHYKTIFERFMHTSSHKYDKVIEILWNEGYKKQKEML